MDDSQESQTGLNKDSPVGFGTVGFCPVGFCPVGFGTVGFFKSANAVMLVF